MTDTQEVETQEGDALVLSPEAQYFRQKYHEAEDTVAVLTNRLSASQAKLRSALVQLQALQEQLSLYTENGDGDDKDPDVVTPDPILDDDPPQEG